MQRKMWAAVAVMAGVALAGPTVLAGAAHQTVGVRWHPSPMQVAPPLNGTPVDGAWAQLTRNDNGFSYRLHTNSLTPGNAYTLWVVVINNRAACAADPCSAGDIITNANTRSQVTYGAGHVVGGSGRATFAGSIKEGPMDGWLADRSLEDAHAAEIHLVVNDHGPMLPEYMPSMIHSYRGGCADRPTSPFPGVFPATALADGEVGPNSCRLTHVAVFQ